jgi:hypothetical protein
VRCLLIAPHGVDLDLLLAVLAEQGAEVVSTAELGAGAVLAQVPLDQVDFGIAVLPSGHEECAAGIPAVYVEIGVAAGRGVPLLVVVEPPEPPSPALAGLTTVSTAFDNGEALRLHLGLFLRSVAAAPSRPEPPPPVMVGGGLADYRERLQTIRSSPPGRRGLEFEQFVVDLLRDAGALTEEPASEGGRDYGVDIAAFVPGEEHRLGTLLVEVKSGRLTSRTLRDSQNKLSTQVLQRRAGLGLFVYDGAVINPEQLPPSPLVFSLTFDQLLSELEHRPLRDVLVHARNRAIHGM